MKHTRNDEREFQTNGKDGGRPPHSAVMATGSQNLSIVILGCWKVWSASPSDVSVANRAGGDVFSLHRRLALALARLHDDSLSLAFKTEALTVFHAVFLLIQS